jgi:hypothetical protein
VPTNLSVRLSLAIGRAENESRAKLEIIATTDPADMRSRDGQGP